MHGLQDSHLPGCLRPMFQRLEDCLAQEVPNKYVSHVGLFKAICHTGEVFSKLVSISESA